MNYLEYDPEWLNDEHTRGIVADGVADLAERIRNKNITAPVCVFHVDIYKPLREDMDMLLRGEVPPMGDGRLRNAMISLDLSDCRRLNSPVDE